MNATITPINEIPIITHIAAGILSKANMRRKARAMIIATAALEIQRVDAGITPFQIKNGVIRSAIKARISKTLIVGVVLTKLTGE
jgi:hypothetical protein